MGIQIKPKKCKPTGIAIGFSSCGNVVYVRKYGLCINCYSKWLLSTKEGQEMIKKVVNYAHRKEIKEAKRIQKEKKESIIDYSKKLQEKINEIVRLIDIGLPCLAKKVHSNQIQAGHIFSRGSSRQMRYNLHNIHRQSAQSNHFQNEDGLFREGLKNEYGESYFNFVFELQKTPALHYSNAEYKSFYQIACVIVLRMRKEGKVFNLQERIKMRNDINSELGIYGVGFRLYI